MAINNQSHRRVRADSHAYPVFGLSSVWGESKDQTLNGPVQPVANNFQIR